MFHITDQAGRALITDGIISRRVPAQRFNFSIINIMNSCPATTRLILVFFYARSTNRLLTPYHELTFRALLDTSMPVHGEPLLGCDGDPGLVPWAGMGWTSFWPMLCGEAQLLSGTLCCWSPTAVWGNLAAENWWLSIANCHQCVGWRCLKPRFWRPTTWTVSGVNHQTWCWKTSNVWEN